MANSVDPDETAFYGPSYLDLHCLHKHLRCSTGFKGLNTNPKPFQPTNALIMKKIKFS